MNATRNSAGGFHTAAHLITLCYPLALHLTISQGLHQQALWLLLAIAVLQFAARRESRATGLFIPALLIGLTLFNLFSAGHFALYLPPLLITGGLWWLFGRSLLPGREPFISRFARVVYGEEDRQTRLYTTRVTWLWTLFLSLMLLEIIYLSLYAPLETWSLYTNIINYLAIVGLFIAEYSFRMLYFRRLPKRRTLSRLTDIRRLGEWLRG